MSEATNHRLGRIRSFLPNQRRISSAGQRTPLKQASWAVSIERHRMLLLALVLAVVFHGSLLIAGSYQGTYDAYVHIFFADHYRRDWFSSWDDRWYTGFSVLSYPPGAHLAIAAVSNLTGLEMGFVVVQLFAILNLVVGVYRWSHLWVARRAAGWAAVLVVVASSIAETVHVFGQLPTTLSLGFLLNSLPFADAWVRNRDRRALVAGIACVMATTAGHHVTTLFGSVFFVAPVLVSAVMEGLRTPLDNESGGHPPKVTWSLIWPLMARRIRRGAPTLIRSAVFGFLLVAALLLVVLPYWLYSKSDPITQISIPHASRDNFLVNVNAGLVFWLVPWGTTLIALPYAVVRGLSTRAWPLALSLLALAGLGTGGTTPIPKMLLGGAYDILTLDRFTFWATIAILPLAGAFVVSITEGSLRRWLEERLGRPLTIAGILLLLGAHLAMTLFAANLTHFKPFQPARIDITPITAFLDKDQHSNWRYLTLGFGDQMAWLGANTTATTVDGNYHSARQLPELTSRPIERLEGAKYSGVPGIGSLQQFLATPGRYHLKYVFSNDKFYDPLLDASGWTELGPLSNGIDVWERADVAPLPAAGYERQAPAWQRIMWGVLPPFSMASALVVLLLNALGLVRSTHESPGHLPRWARPLDRRLLRSAAKLPEGTVAAQRRGSWIRLPELVVGIRRRSRLPVRPGLRRLYSRFVAGLIAVGLVLAGALLLVPAPPGPASVAQQYFEHLDFRRFASAYELLDPDRRPTFDQYQSDLGRDGGLVASFAKLQNITVTREAEDGESATVGMTLEYLTSLQSYKLTKDIDLHRRNGQWKITPPAPDPSRPPQQFVSRPNVTFQSQPRRSGDAAATSAADVLDRPEVSLSEVRTVLFQGRWTVVGKVTNVDTDPADVTVEAQLRDQDQALLGEWDAAQVMIHKLLPGASSPFRIEFQSIAGKGNYGTESDGGLAGPSGPLPSAPSSTVKSSSHHGALEFDPAAVSPLVIPAGREVSSSGVYARAVVTTAARPPALQVTDLRTWVNPDGSQVLKGTLRNDGTSEVSVPHLLMSYTAPDGRLGWVDHVYLESSLGPQLSSEFTVPLPSSSDITDAGVPTSGYSGPAHAAFQESQGASIELPSSTGFTAVEVKATGYYRLGAP